MDFRLQSSRPKAWGVRRIEVDQEAIANGRFNLLALEAVLADGTLIRLPSIDPVPTGRDLTQSFTVDRAHLDVFLALPEDRPGLPRVRLSGTDPNAPSRFVATTSRLADENAPGPDSEITVAHQNLRILVSGDNLDGYTTLPIARVERSGDGTMMLSRNYAPPAVAIQGAGPVPGIVRAVLENLSAKSDALGAQTRHGGETVQFGVSDVMLYWQLHTVNSYIPVMSFFQRHPECHPMDVYLVIAQLAGALCTFAVGRHPREIPPYDHENLGGTFRSLEKIIRELSEVTTATRFDRVPLTKIDDAMLKGDVQDVRLFEPAYHWYLAVSGDLAEDRIRDELPSKITIGSTHNVEFLVRQALRGVPITYTAIPPRDFPLKAGHVYFRLQNHGETWDTIAEARAISLYLRGAELKGLSFELIVMEP
jgi:type VI secretion system protein ImpJ